MPASRDTLKAEAVGQPGEDKAVIRAEALRRRNAIPLPVRRAKDRMIRERLYDTREWMFYTSIFLYASFRSEVSTETIMDDALRGGRSVILPRSHREACSLTLHLINSPEELEPGYMGIPEPPMEYREVSHSEVGFALVPGVAFTPDGSRLGYGKGFYDRLLKDLKGKAPIIGICYHEQVFDTIPTEAHDIKADIVITDRGVMRAGDG